MIISLLGGFCPVPVTRVPEKAIFWSVPVYNKKLSSQWTQKEQPQDKIIFSHIQSMDSKRTTTG